MIITTDRLSIFMIFTELTTELQSTLKSNIPQIRFLLKKNPAMAYSRLVELGKQVGKKYNISLLVNFPHEGKIEEFDMYGKRDLSLIIDREKTNFPISREIIKQKAKEILGELEVQDAYMYEGKEGVRVFAPGGKIDILPHSLHIWTIFDKDITLFCDWLMENVYLIKQKSN